MLDPGDDLTQRLRGLLLVSDARRRPFRAVIRCGVSGRTFHQLFHPIVRNECALFILRIQDRHDLVFSGAEIVKLLLLFKRRLCDLLILCKIVLSVG